MLTGYPNKMMGKAKRCPVCNDRGLVVETEPLRGAPFMFPELCPRCHGLSSRSIEHKDVNDAPDGPGN